MSAEDTRATVRINRPAKDALAEMAGAAGCSQQKFVEALLNYAYSIYQRPGSWEASTTFDIHTYTRPDSVADRWF